MTDLIYDFISTGVDLLLIGAVLAAMIVMMRGSTQLTQLISDQQVTTEEFDYYLQYHAYDNQVGLSSADALSAIVGNRFDIWVCIKDGSTCYINNPETGKYYKTNFTTIGKTPSQCATAMTTTIAYQDLSKALNPSAMYKAKLVVLDNGKFQVDSFNRDTVIFGIYFERYL